MALFLIIEPHEDIRRLYAAVVRGLGHEAAFFNGLPVAHPQVVLVEPAQAESLEAALLLQRDNPGLPIVCASIDGPNGGTRRLEPVAHLVKPFALPDIEAALTMALDARPVPA